MLPKKFKLPIEDFPKKGELVYRGELLSLKKTENDLGRARIGVVVGKRINPKATTRNSLKRLIYNFARESLPKLPTGTDLLVVIEAPMIEVSSEAKKTLLSNLSKAVKALDNK